MSERARGSSAVVHRKIVESLPEIEQGESLRVVTASEDVLARAMEDACEHEKYGGRFVAVRIKVYGDTRFDHEKSTLSWSEPGPVMLEDEGFEQVHRLDRL